MYLLPELMCSCGAQRSAAHDRKHYEAPTVRFKNDSVSDSYLNIARSVDFSMSLASWVSIITEIKQIDKLSMRNQIPLKLSFTGKWE